MKKDEENIDFIARHYKKDKFSPYSGWHRLGVENTPWWRRYGIAAAIATLIIFTATATILYHEYCIKQSDMQENDVSHSEFVSDIQVIDFENAVLTEVISKIETVYGVRVENLPENIEDYVLSLHYVGTATDLISVINDILGTQMTVVE